MQQETQPTKHERTQFAILNTQKLSKLPQKEADRIIRNIQYLESNLKQQESSGNTIFCSLSQQEVGQCFIYIKEWAISTLNYCSVDMLFGLGPQPKTPFYNIFHIKFTNLKKLGLSNKEIRHFQSMHYPESFNLLQNLQFSSCDFDHMSTLLFFPLHQIKRLSLNQNSIECASFLQFIQFSELKALSLVKNQLSHSSELEYLSMPVLEILDLRRNKLEVLHFISATEFLRLKILNLCQNQITSIECMTRAELPHLQMLNLTKNKISSIRPLRRLSLPNIREISVAGNLILEFYPIVELHCKGASVFFNTLDNCLATGTLAKMPSYIGTNFKDIKNASIKPDRFIEFFGQFSKPLYGNFTQTYKILSQRNFENVEKKLLNDISYY